MLTNEAVVFGILITILALIFKTQEMERFKTFYKFVPGLLLCYFLPSVLNTIGVVDPKVTKNLYHVSSRYLLPASLILLTVSIDLKGIISLGPKALIMFLTATAGIMIGGPVAILIVSFFSPETFAQTGPEAVWRGLVTVAGSWIGGGANQAAMKEVFKTGDHIFSAMIAVDVFVAKVSMAFLFFGAANSEAFDRWFKADNSAINALKDKMEAYKNKIAKIPSLTDFMMVLAVGLGITGLSHLLADNIAPWIEKNYPSLNKYSLTSSFFWLIMIATTLGVLLSFTRAKELEGVGASRVGSAFLYILVATIGMKMDILAILEAPMYFIIGLIWIAFHMLLLLIVGKLIKAPFFFTAVGSQANVGGAASAPVVASAFHPALAPVGVMLAILGYALGTYGAYICGLMMKALCQ